MKCFYVLITYQKNTLPFPDVKPVYIYIYIYVIKQTTTYLYLFPEIQLLYISATYQTITSSLEYNDNNKNTTMAEQFQNQIEIS